ncbi:MAG: hypothetical protein QM723_26085 [Myxococcaceae bacterium]
MERRGLSIAVVVAIALLGFGARLLPWRAVFTPDGVDLVPADTHYYLRWAQLQLHADGWVQRDPYLNFPGGALVYWPPVHTRLVELFVAGAGGKDDVEKASRGGAWVDPVLSLGWLLLLGLLVLRWWGKWAAWVATWVLAVTPMAVESGPLGSADHHLHELCGAALVMLISAEWLGRGGARWAWAAGAVGALMRLLSPLGLIYPFVVLGAGAADAFFRGKVKAVDLLWAGAGAATVSALAALVYGDLFNLELELIGGFAVLSELGVAALSVLALSVMRRGSVRLVVAGAVGSLALIPVAQQYLRGLGQVMAEDPILKMAEESKPLWSDPVWARTLLGALLLLGPLALVGTVFAARRDRRLIAALVPLALFLPAAGKQARLMYPALGCLALVLWPGLVALFEAWGASERRKRFASAFVGLALASLALQLSAGEPGPGLAKHLRPALEWLHTQTPLPSSGPFAADKPAWGVLSNHLAGHFILLWGQRPVVATTFGQTKWHREANDTATKILTDPDVPHARAAAKALGIRYLLVYRHMPLLGASPEVEAASMAHQLAEGPVQHDIALRYDADGVRIFELEQ